ncbi:uncharacterized protein LOC133709465 isoform X2 [Rosa rugosa]|nr:uncharacterized protein LOC133709465 isoform X2 [Rosa rugosa]
MKVYHGGYMDHINNKYVGGKISYYDNVDKDKMSLVEVDSMVRGIDPSYVGKRIDYWFSIGSEDDATTKVNNDQDVITMCCCVPDIRLVILYLDHRDLWDDVLDDVEDDFDDFFVFEQQQWGFSQAGSSGVVIEELPESPRKPKSSVKIDELLESPNRQPEVAKQVKGRRYKVCAQRKKLSSLKISEPQEEIPTQASKAPTSDPTDKGKKKVEFEEGLFEEDSDDDGQDDSLHDDDHDGLLHEEEETGQGNSSGDDESADDDYNPAADDEEYAAYGVDDDFLFEWLTEEEDGQTVGGEGCSKADEGVSGNNDMEGDEDEDTEGMFGAVDSDEEGIGHEADSEDDGVGGRFPEFNPNVDMKNPWFCKGMKFATAKILRAAIRERAIQKGWEAVFLKNDRGRIRAICKAENCPFDLYASKMQHEDTLMIKNYNGQHTCARVIENSTVRTPYLTEKFANQIKLHPDISTESLAQTMAASVRAKVSFQQAYRTKKAALKLIERSIKEQYARVQDYAQELKRVDPNTTVDIKCDFNNPDQQPVFKRMYICLGALKMGFRAGCRPILGLDGCHLKSAYGGQLLAAVGLDPNNTTYVVAYAMVEMESKDSWDWFLRLLAKDLNITGEGNGFTFISDKQKGLLPACEAVLPLADHRYCVRHLWTNFNKLYPGKVMKDQLWAIAKSSTMAYYTKEMVLMKQLDPKAYDWLTDPQRNPRHWCRSHFQTFLKCDVLLNNLCESFNAFVLPARSKPVISCFEDIRVKMMKRVAMRKEKMSKVVDPICPKPRQILEKNKERSASDCIPYGSGSPQIEVESCGGSRYVVDLTRRTCACRRWDLTGIPCKHAISAIHFMRQNPDDYVDACYLTKTYMDIYSNTVKPVNGMDLWIPCDEPTILPPQYNRQPGRPRTKRIKDVSERETEGPKVGRVQKSLKCSNCHQLGHNVKTCHRHLPPKEKAAKKRKLNTGEGSSTATQAKGTRKAPKTKNDLRAKARLRAVEAKKKRDEKKAASKASIATATSTKGRPPKPPSSKGKVASSQASSRPSVRIRDNSKKAGK